jgi:hypothetical protein
MYIHISLSPEHSSNSTILLLQIETRDHLARHGGMNFDVKTLM